MNTTLLRVLLWVVMLLATAAWGLCLFSHIAAYWGVVVFRESGAMILGFGGPLLGAVIVLLFRFTPLHSDQTEETFWKRHFPRWLRAIFLVFFLYAGATILTALVSDQRWKAESKADEQRGRTLAIRTFTGVWLFIYAIPLFLSFVAETAIAKNERKCVNSSRLTGAADQWARRSENSTDFEGW